MVVPQQRTIVSNKPVLTYVTFEQKYSRMLGANKVGIVETPNELLDKANKLLIALSPTQKIMIIILHFMYLN